MSKRSIITLAIASVAIFMVTLDNLVVTTALPSIRRDLGASLEDLEWTVNAYTLAFAVFLLTGAALGDRFGRRRMFLFGIGVFTAASAAAALAPSTEALIAARAIQGLGGAIVAPLTLTLLSEAFPAEKRGLALGIWSGIGGLAVAMGPLAGGAIIESISWQWIFWVNVPVGLALLPIARRGLAESHGPAGRLDLPGVALATTGLLGIVYATVRGNELGWDSTTVVGSYALGAVFLLLFGLWERRAPAPMLPLRFFRSRAFAATSGVSLAMSFGIFGSIFLLAQYFQTVKGYGPLEAGLRTLPWTGMPMLVAPIAGALSDRIGSRPLMAAGLAAAGGRDRVAGGGHDDRRRLLGARPRLRARRHRHGAGVLARRQRDPRRRETARGGPGLRRQQRDPRARRRPRRRGPRRGVQRDGRLRVRPGVRRRAAVGAVGRRGGAGRGRRGGAARAGARAERDGAGPARPRCRSRPRLVVPVPA